MCRQCKKKLTLIHKRFRLEKKIRNIIATSFWQNLSAEEASKNLCLNRKTIQRYYKHIRTKLTIISDREIYEFYDLNYLLKPDTTCVLFYIVYINYTFRIITEGMYCEIAKHHIGIEPHYILRVAESDDGDRLRPNTFSLRRQTSLSCPDRERAVKFAQHLRKKLHLLRSPSRDNIYSYLKEIEFKFNQPEESVGIDFLISVVNQP